SGTRGGIRELNVYQPWLKFIDLSSGSLCSFVDKNSGVIQGFIIRSNDKTLNCSFFGFSFSQNLRTMASRTLSMFEKIIDLFVCYAEVVKSVRKSSTTDVALDFSED